MFYLNCLNIYIEPLEGLKTWNLRLIKKINNYVAECEQRYIRERKGTIWAWRYSDNYKIWLARITDLRSDYLF